MNSQSTGCYSVDQLVILMRRILPCSFQLLSVGLVSTHQMTGFEVIKCIINYFNQVICVISVANCSG